MVCNEGMDSGSSWMERQLKLRRFPLNPITKEESACPVFVCFSGVVVL